MRSRPQSRYRFQFRHRSFILAFAAVLLAGCASGGGGYGYRDPGYYGGDRYARCANCGVVERIERVYGRRDSSGGGAILGGIVGGVLGSQVGSGSGRDAATIAGAIAGGVAGNEIEKERNAQPRYELFVRMDDGRRLVIDQRELNGIREGDVVRISGGRARLR